MHSNPARDDLADAVRTRLSSALIALDFDGTLAPLVLDPSTSRLADGAADALTRLAVGGARIGLITGRAAQTVIDLSGLQELPGLTVHGIYGAQRWQGGQLETLPDASEIAAARESLPAAVAAVPGTEEVWIEDKRLSLVVHTRRGADPRALLDALHPGVRAVAERAGLELHDGHFVLELRLPGFDKGQVLEQLARDTGCDIVMYAGDDVGDKPAFEAIAELRDRGVAAFAVLVGGDNRELDQLADVVVDGPAELVELLAAITAQQPVDS